MKTKHTPGPWVFDDYESLRQENGRSVVLRGTTTLSSGPRDALDEARANTRLCAAAPELLEALQSALCALEVCGKSYDHAMDKGRAAIRKALGEEK